jgi:chloramphenicol-sensitive protein RarD
VKKGVWYAVGAYVTWGFFPIYWKWLQQVPALQLLGHRIIWSFLFLFFIVLWLRQGRLFREAISSPRVLLIYSTAAILLAINWLTYVWAVNAGFIVETSLGYFINPLLSMVLGVVILRERLRLWQWVPVGLATIGVVYLTVAYGSLPWIGLILAFSFGLYGFIKKTAPLGSLHGVTLETGILFLPALLFLLYTEATGAGAFLHSGMISNLLMVGAGVVTAVPLLMFAAASQRIPLSLVGVLQYIAPTMYFLIGVLLYNEPLTTERLIGFCIIWAALVIFAVEGFLHHQTQVAVIE